MHVDLDWMVDAERPLAEVARRPRLGERLLEPLDRECQLSPNVDVGNRRADRIAGDDRPLDETVRIQIHDTAVLERPGLALVGVDDEVDLLPFFRVEKTPLHSCWKACASTAPKVGLFDLFFELCGLSGG